MAPMARLHMSEPIGLTLLSLCIETFIGQPSVKYQFTLSTPTFSKSLKI